MADAADSAGEVNELMLQSQLDAQAARAAGTKRVAPTGCCQNRNCLDEFPPGDQRLFCDSRCAAEYERLKRF